MEGPRLVCDYFGLSSCVLRVPWYVFYCLEWKNKAYIVGCHEKQKVVRINPIINTELCLYPMRYQKKFQEFRGFRSWRPSILRIGQFYKGIRPKMAIFCSFFCLGHNLSQDPSFWKPSSLVIYIFTILSWDTHMSHIFVLLIPRPLRPLLTFWPKWP